MRLSGDLTVCVADAAKRAGAATHGFILETIAEKKPSKLSDVQTLMPLLKIAMPKVSRRQNHCGPDVQEQNPLIGDWPSHQRLPRLYCQEFGT